MNNTPKSHAQFVPFSRDKNRAAVVIPKDLSRSTMMLGSLCDGDTATRGDTETTTQEVTLYYKQ